MPHLEDIEHHVDGRCGEGFTSPMPEPLESGDEVLIEDRYLTVEDECGLGKRADPSKFTKSGMIPTIPAEEMDLPVSLERENPPSVVLFLINQPSRSKGRAMGVGCIREM